jgi:hypothetical protein
VTQKGTTPLLWDLALDWIPTFALAILLPSNSPFVFLYSALIVTVSDLFHILSGISRLTKCCIRFPHSRALYIQVQLIFRNILILEVKTLRLKLSYTMSDEKAFANKEPQRVDSSLANAEWKADPGLGDIIDGSDNKGSTPSILCPAPTQRLQFLG